MVLKHDLQRVVRCYLAGMSVCPPCFRQITTAEEMTEVCSMNYSPKNSLPKSSTMLVTAFMQVVRVDRISRPSQKRPVSLRYTIAAVFNSTCTLPGALIAPESLKRISSVPFSKGFQPDSGRV